MSNSVQSLENIVGNRIIIIVVTLPLFFVRFLQRVKMNVSENRLVYDVLREKVSVIY